MIVGRILLSIFIVIIIGIIGSLLYIHIHKKDLFGGKRTGLFVGIIGGVLGGFIFDLFFKISFLQNLINIPYIKYLLVNQFDINFIAVILGIWTFLTFYDYVSEHTERS